MRGKSKNTARVGGQSVEFDTSAVLGERSEPGSRVSPRLQTVTSTAKSFSVTWLIASCPICIYKVASLEKGLASKRDLRRQEVAAERELRNTAAATERELRDNESVIPMNACRLPKLKRQEI